MVFWQVLRAACHALPVCTAVVAKRSVQSVDPESFPCRKVHPALPAHKVRCAALCLTCFAGSFSQGLGVSSCFSCEAGRFSTVLGANFSSVCLQCPSKLWSSPGQSTCAVCPPGSFTPNATACLPCHPFMFSNASSSTVCIQCTGSNAVQASRTVCAPCLSGSYPTSSGCQPCPEGTFSVAPNTTCTVLVVEVSSSLFVQNCPAGTFAGSPGLSVCQSCPSSTVSFGAATACGTCWSLGVLDVLGSKLSWGSISDIVSRFLSNLPAWHFWEPCASDNLSKLRECQSFFWANDMPALQSVSVRCQFRSYNVHGMSCWSCDRGHRLQPLQCRHLHTVIVVSVLYVLCAAWLTLPQACIALLAHTLAAELRAAATANQDAFRQTHSRRRVFHAATAHSALVLPHFARLAPLVGLLLELSMLPVGLVQPDRHRPPAPVCASTVNLAISRLQLLLPAAHRVLLQHFQAQRSSLLVRRAPLERQASKAAQPA